MKVTKEMGVTMRDTTITSGEPVFLDVTKPPFDIYGLCEGFCRLPRPVAEATSKEVAELSLMPAGGRIRFKTDSDYVVVMPIRTELLRTTQTIRMFQGAALICLR